MITEEQRKKSLKYSVIDGSFYSVMLGFGESFIAAFAVFLGATSFQLSLLGALPQMLGSMMLLWFKKIYKHFSTRKAYICTFAALHGTMYLVMALAYFFGALSPIVLIAAVCLYWMFGMLPGPAWTAWMAELVPEKFRGEYFGRRNRIANLVAFLSYIIAGYILQIFTDNSIRYLGFLFLFGVAIIARSLSTYFLSRKTDVPYQFPDKIPSFKEFLGTITTTSYGKLALFLWCMNFAVFISAPFFTPYMLRDLHFNYIEFAMANAAVIVVKFIFMPIWGKASDKYGTRKLFVLSSMLLFAVPLTWLFGNSFLYVVLIQAFSGFVWAGFEITSFNFLLETTEQKLRPIYITYYTVLNGVFSFIGALIGGVLATLTVLFSSGYLLTFFVSGVTRAIVPILFVKSLREIRSVENISYKDLLFDTLTIEPTMGVMHTLVSVTQQRVSNFFEDIEIVLDKLTHHLPRKSEEETTLEIDEGLDDTDQKL